MSGGCVAWATPALVAPGDGSPGSSGSPRALDANARSVASESVLHLLFCMQMRWGAFAAFLHTQKAGQSLNESHIVVQYPSLPRPTKQVFDAQSVFLLQVAPNPASVVCAVFLPSPVPSMRRPFNSETWLALACESEDALVVEDPPPKSPPSPPARLTLMPRTLLPAVAGALAAGGGPAAPNAASR